MPKILIFGLGNVFNEYVGRIDMNEVAGFSDNSFFQSSIFEKHNGGSSCSLHTTRL